MCLPYDTSLPIVGSHFHTVHFIISRVWLSLVNYCQEKMETFVIYHIAQLTYTSSYPGPPSTTEPAWMTDSYTDTWSESESHSCVWLFATS